jgi:hypothetical protein
VLVAQPGSVVCAMNELSDYLNDHLAGSVALLELLDRVVVVFEGKPLERFFRDLRADIQEDQEKLTELIAKLDMDQSVIRKASAWFMEKLSRPTIDLDDESQIGLFLALEALVLGITGKRSLWRALQAASRTVPQLARLDYSELEKRAIDQCERVEARRLEIARGVFKAS